MRRFAVLAVCFLLSACFPAGRRGTESVPAIYDLGLSPAILVAERPVGLALEVHAPPWLDAVGIDYRLAYRDAAQRHEYAHARWAGPPAQLIQQRLRQSLALSGQGQARASCFIRLEISEFGQIFATPESSKGLLLGRAYWLDRSRRPIAELNLEIEKPAPTPDSSGGIKALQATVDQLSIDLLSWEKRLRQSGKISGCSS